MSKTQILQEIMIERERQDKKWGGAEHDKAHIIEDWLRFVLHQIDDIEKETERAGDLKLIRKDFIQIAALGVAAIESIDRKVS